MKGAEQITATRQAGTGGGQDNATVSGLSQASSFLSRVDVGSLPVILGLVLIAVIFQIANPNFLTPLNLTNLMVQLSATGTISVGIVLILLIGEIDLSVGAVSGFCASIMAVLSVKSNVPAPIAVGSGVVVGALIGLLQGYWFAKIHVPSFVVTLAGSLAWQGALLYALGSTGTINLSDLMITGISNNRLDVWWGWALGIAFVGIYAVSALRSRAQRSRAGVAADPLAWTLVRVAVVTLAVLIAIYLMNVNRSFTAVSIQGVPYAVLVFVGFVVFFDYVVRRTQFGRYIFAVGGNAEAARRAGINVDRIRIIVFVLGSTLAACGGVLAGARLLAVNQSSGSGDVLLNAIAAAVIGGTSLFGGRGSTWSALLGALVIQSISNGMDLLALSSSIKFMVTGTVLLLAVTLDAYARSRREASGG
ncbi:MAG: sugar ABC transporter permease [Chloroflexi bacterium]|nr:sugar ABC transporter permease [Chloroflexota bacterium]